MPLVDYVGKFLLGGLNPRENLVMQRVHNSVDIVDNFGITVGKVLLGISECSIVNLLSDNKEF